VRHLLRLAAIFLVGSIGATAVLAATVPQIAKLATSHDEEPLPVPKLATEPRRSIMYNNLGGPIDVLKVEDREPFPLANVPPDVVAAVLAVEDADFWNHHGANGRSVLRALRANVSAGTTEQGGSTITQQVVKNLIFPTLPRDVQTKALEAVTAVRLEKEIGKEAVLERYLNTVFLGNNAYGLQAGAERYFGKNVTDLTLVEGAYLAGLIRNPTEYDPFVRPERSQFRFRQVLDRLVAVERLTDTEAAEIQSTFVVPSSAKASPELAVSRSYFSDAVKEFLLNESTILGETRTERFNALFRGGLRIYTTINPFLQAFAENATTILPRNAQGFDAALLALDTKTGAVLAMRGGPGFNQSQVNLTTQAKRQTGSAVKYFILAAALAAGAQPNDVLDGRSPCTLPNPGNPTEPFEIRDAVSRGVVPLEQHTWASINCAYARLAQIIGLNRVVDTMYRMGVKTELLAIPSLATGNNEMTVMDMVTGFQTLANQGAHMTPYYVERIEGPDGTVIYQHADPGTPVFFPVTANTAIDILKGVLTRGTGRRGPLAGGRPAAGKTGTQFRNTNAWFVGATPQITAGVWVGDPKGQTPMNGIPEFEFPRIQGGTYPVLIWKAFMDAAHQNLPFEDWPPPPEPGRPPRRLFLPGDECVYRTSVVVAPQAPTPPVVDPAAPVTAPPVQYRSSLDIGATGLPVPADVVDPFYPLPSAALGTGVHNCRSGPPPPPAPPPPAPPPPAAPVQPAAATDAGGEDGGGGDDGGGGGGNGGGGGRGNDGGGPPTASP
jgi:penicillin-binding protein 1A